MSVIADMLGKVVLVRDQAAGVHVGELVEFNPDAKSATLKNARKVWFWEGAASVHGIAARGLNHKKSKVCPVVPLVTTVAVIEVVMCTPEGAENVAAAPEWKP